MTTYAFWNNKGGTGKTSLAFQTICHYADTHSKDRIAAVDMCPQANLSELLLGSLVGSGSDNLTRLHQEPSRKSIAGYFQARLPSPFTTPQINADLYTTTPSRFNPNIPPNIDLVPGDGLVELQANAISTLANTQIPGHNTWQAVINWGRDIVTRLSERYSTIFIDTNPTFSVYTQMALAASDRLIVPVMADDSSRRAVENVFSLVHGINIPAPIYQQYSFQSRLSQSGQKPPLIHLFVNNRLTQYMGPASAYRIVLKSIERIIAKFLQTHATVFSFTSTANGIIDVRDFGTTGVVAFAKGISFARLVSGRHDVLGQNVQVNQDNTDLCSAAISQLVSRL